MGKSDEPDRDRELFESAVEELERMSARDLVALKSEPASARRAVAASPRLERLVRRDGFRTHAVLDLHGLSRTEAVASLRQFVKDQGRGRSASDPHIVLVIHGRGSGALAKTVVAELDRLHCVAEHLAAPRRLGGPGARVARLRSER